MISRDGEQTHITEIQQNMVITSINRSSQPSKQQPVGALASMLPSPRGAINFPYLLLLLIVDIDIAPHISISTSKHFHLPIDT